MWHASCFLLGNRAVLILKGSEMKTISAFGTLLLAALSAPSWAIPIVGDTDPANNSGDFNFEIASPFELRVGLQNTSNFDARITGFGFDINHGLALGLWSVSGTLDNNSWNFSFDAIPGPDDRDAFAITGANLWGGQPNDGISVGSTGLFSFLGLFANDLTISNVAVRFQQTGPRGQGSDKGFGCATACVPTPPPTNVPEPATLMLFGVGLAILGGVATRRRHQSSLGVPAV
jgi:hypothetical protein